jgi:HD superfamily phosphohydrolase
MYEKYVINDPIHEVIRIGDTKRNWLRPFIDSENFQRLRNIKQMGLADIAYPGAVHTRFNHSIGTSYIGGRIAAQLQLTQREKQKVMVACLLHDIGHGPFSHGFEGLFKDEKGQKKLTHEEWTPKFLEHYRSKEFIERFNRTNKLYPIDEEFFADVNRFITHSHVRGESQVLADIVSSQLDADRMDYLLRDGHFCGVSYGNYDLNWLIHCLTVCEDQFGNRRLATSLKGVGAVEQFLIARSLIIKNLCVHKKVNAAEFLLISMLKEIQSHLDEPLFDILRDSPLFKFLEATRGINDSNKQEIINKSFDYYRMLCDFDVYYVVRYLYTMHDKYHHLGAVRLAKRLYKRQLPLAYRIKPEKIDEVRDMIEAEKSHIPVESWQISFHSPKFTVYRQKQEPIYVVEKGKIIASLAEESKIIDSISDLTEDICFLFVDQRAYEENPRIQKLINNLTDVWALR